MSSFRFAVNGVVAHATTIVKKSSQLIRPRPALPAVLLPQVCIVTT